MRAPTQPSGGTSVAPGATLQPADAAAKAPLPSPSPEQQAQWQRCDGAARTIMERTGSSYERTSDLLHNTFLTHPNVNEMTVGCGIGGEMSVTALWDGGYPSDGFFAVLANAGTVVTGDAPQPLLTALRRCHRKALKSTDETGDDGTHGGKIDCQVFTRDGGGVNMTITAR